MPPTCKDKVSPGVVAIDAITEAPEPPTSMLPLQAPPCAPAAATTTWVTPAGTTKVPTPPVYPNVTSQSPPLQVPDPDAQMLPLMELLHAERVAGGAHVWHGWFGLVVPAP